MTTSNLESLIAQPCLFTFVTGPKIGQRCGQLTNGSGRCIIHTGVHWPKDSFLCKRVLTRGERAGQACGKSTKFEDGICSVCRKCGKDAKPKETPTEQFNESQLERLKAKLEKDEKRNPLRIDAGSPQPNRLYKKDFQVGDLVATGTGSLAVQGPIIEMKQQKAVVRIGDERWSIWYGSLIKC